MAPPPLEPARGTPQAGPRRPRAVAVHGFAQTGRCWGTVPADLAALGFEVLTPDLPGHGSSAHPALDLPATAAVVGQLGGRATYLGYSFGGRVCLRLAVDRPDLVERLVLVSATAGIEDGRERAARVAADDRLAAALEADGLPAFLDRWLSLPLFAGVPEHYRYRVERLRNTPAGLAASLRKAGTGAQQPLWQDLHRLGMPVLVVTGELDAKFHAIGERLARDIGAKARQVVVPGAGHTVHLEQPERFRRVLEAWLTGEASAPSPR